MRDLFEYPEPQADPRRPIIVDSFAGGGGASTGIEMALGRSPDVAINHSEKALAMHEANHPTTKHMINSIYSVDPLDATEGRPVGLAWFSPDCKHHSKAKGGKPVNKNIRDLAWVVVHWAERVRPAVIMLENVEEFQDWCPLTPDNKPDKARKGETFRKWVSRLRRLGYKVEWRELRACDYGAPTIRKRLFVIARCDGKPIIWPEPTHGKPDSDEVLSGKLKPWRSAAEIIDWSLPCPSIFDTSEEIKEKYGLRAIRPLADKTLRRIARGVMRYVVDAKEPYLVTYGQHGGANRSAFAPLHTVTASRKDQNAVIVPSLVQVGYGERKGQAPRSLDIHQPMGTVVASSSKHAVVAAFLAQHNGGERMKNHAGRSAEEPLSTLTARGTQQQIVAASMVSLRGTSDSQLKGIDVREPIRTVSAGGGHAGIVAAFLQKYYGQGVGQDLREPAHTLGTRDTMGVVTVGIDGTTYAITDIGMRMLTPREQFRAQGFPESYEIEQGANGIELTKTDQNGCCGNSVCPDVAKALAAANCSDLAAWETAA